MAYDSATPKKPYEINAVRPGRSFDYVKSVKTEAQAVAIAKKAQRKGFEVTVTRYDFSGAGVSYRQILNLSAPTIYPW
jgi:hypothetical protein